MIFTNISEQPVRYTCNNNECGKSFYRISNIEEDSKIKCPHCTNGVMEISEL